MPSTTIKEIWKEAWSVRIKRQRLIAMMVLVPAFSFSLPVFFHHIEKRNGIVLNDWVLAQIPAHNVSVLIFAVIWGMVLLILYRALYNPTILINYLFTLAVVTLARVTCISFIALNPPVGLIPLTDPLTGVFYGDALIVKDLFFSGHIATLAAIFLCLERKTDRWVGFFAVCLVAVLLLIQHIHYTIDVLAAPVITYVCYRCTIYFLNFKKESEVYEESEAISTLD
jgi:hypothetical protein